MKREWSQIKKWLKKNSPELYKDLLPGLSMTKIIKTENEFGIKLPDDYKESLSLCNGQLGMADNLLGDWSLLSLEATMKEWNGLNSLFIDDLDKIYKIEQIYWWNKKWIPIAYNGAGDFLCIDLSNSQSKTYKQIIAFWHTKEDRPMIFKNFKNLIEIVYKDLLAGKHKYDR